MTADAVGGVWGYALSLAGALAPRGVRTTLAVMGPPPDESQRADARAVPGLTLVERPYRLEWMDAPWDDVAAAGSWLLALAATERADVVHLNGYVHAALSWPAPVVVAAHSCVLSWWEAVRGEPAPATWDRYRAAVTRGVRAADVVVAPTRAMLASVERHYGHADTSRVIPNGADPARHPPDVKESFVLSAGRLWDEAKNVATLDRAAADVPWPVWVAGATAHPSGGDAVLAHAHPLGALRRGDVAAMMSRAAIFALPARYEPFGLAALEAALAGCALVLGDIPSLREVWGDAAVFVVPDDAVALAAAITALATDAGRRAELAARASRRALAYTPERAADAYLDVYQQLAPGAQLALVRDYRPRATGVGAGP